MSINRHNYESYFILYLDNELDESGRRMVEAFAAQHPDLQEELEMLAQFKLVPDQEIVFEGKEELLRENGQPLITLSNYEEWFTLLVDRELNPAQEIQLQEFIAANPHTAAELESFMKTRLEPEIISFPGKTSLYRKEEKTRRIFPLYFRAAAAILLLLLSTATVILLNRNTQKGETDLAKNPGKQIAPVQDQRPAPEQTIPQVNPADQSELPAKESLAQTSIEPVKGFQPKELKPENQTVRIREQKVKAPLPANSNNEQPQQEEAVLAARNIQPSNNLPQPSYNPNVLNNAVAANPATSQSIASNPAPANIIKPVVTSAGKQPSDIVHASYPDDREEEQTDGKKNRNRGIFRKIARTFEKRTSIDPTDENRLLVAGLSIKLK